MVGLLCLVALVLAVVAIRRSGPRGALAERIERIERLEREVRELRILLAALRPEAGAAPAAVEPAPIAPAPPVARPVPEAAPARAVAPAPPARPGPPPPAAAGAPGVGIDWERWFGVRAAAVLGGVALALAGLLFFKYSIEHGLIPPWLRVVIGTLVGVGCIVGSEGTLRPRYAGTANALAGAGVVVLYAAFWAASVHYRLVGIPVSFVLMVAVTAACCALSWRHASQVIALLGLVGGFATPLLLASGAHRPVGLFGYVLLLDLGLLVLARQRRWPLLTVLSLAATLLYEVLWIGGRMGSDRLFLGLGILAVFVLLFALAPALAPAEDRAEWLAARAAAVLFPFAFALYFATSARFDPHLHPVALLLLLLCTAAGWIGRAEKTYWLGLGAASATVAVVAAWLLARDLDVARAREAVVWCVVLAAAMHVFVEWEPAREGADGPAPAALVASVGLLVVLIGGSTRALAAAPWPWLAAFLGLGALVIRHAVFPGRGQLHVVAAVAVAIGLATVERVHGQRPGFPPHAVYLGVALGVAVAFQAVAVAHRSPSARRWADHGAAALCVVLLLHLMTAPGIPPASAWLFLGVTGTFGLLIALAATRLGAGSWLLVAVLATAIVQGTWTVDLHAPAVATTALGLEAAAVLVFTAWPFLAAARFRGEPFAWRAAALAAPAWFLSLRSLFVLRFGDAAIGLLPVSLAVVCFVAALRARDLWPASEPLRTMALAWFSAAAMGFVTVAIPLQLEKEWVTIGWALQGLALTALWVRLDHPGLKYFGLALLAGATARLLNPAVLGYYPRPAFRIVNWLMYTYLVPAAALLATAALLEPREAARARPWERERWYAGGWPIAAIGCGAAGLVVIFVWINLAIADWFTSGPVLRLSFERLPARDLTTSLAWAIYALVLLAVGMGRGRIGLRWASLGLLMITIAKVFLHDLGELRDLYRVASLLGLAVSLIAVSLAYQRFVFRDAAAEQT